MKKIIFEKNFQAEISKLHVRFGHLSANELFEIRYKGRLNRLSCSEIDSFATLLSKFFWEIYNGIYQSDYHQVIVNYLDILIEPDIFEIDRYDLEVLANRYLNILIVADKCELDFLSIAQTLLKINTVITGARTHLIYIQNQLLFAIEDEILRNDVTNYLKLAIAQIENLKSKYESDSYLHLNKNKFEKISVLNKSDFGYSLDENERTERELLFIERNNLIDPLIYEYIRFHPNIAPHIGVKYKRVPNGLLILLAGLMLTLVEKGWIIESLSSRNRVDLLKETFNLDIKNHVPFADNRTNYEKNYGDRLIMFSDMPHSQHNQQ